MGGLPSIFMRLKRVRRFKIRFWRSGKVNHVSVQDMQNQEYTSFHQADFIAKVGRRNDIPGMIGINYTINQYRPKYKSYHEDVRFFKKEATNTFIIDIECGEDRSPENPVAIGYYQIADSIKDIGDHNQCVDTVKLLFMINCSRETWYKIYNMPHTPDEFIIALQREFPPKNPHDDFK